MRHSKMSLDKVPCRPKGSRSRKVRDRKDRTKAKTRAKTDNNRASVILITTETGIVALTATTGSTGGIASTATTAE